MIFKFHSGKRLRLWLVVADLLCAMFGAAAAENFFQDDTRGILNASNAAIQLQPDGSAALLVDTRQSDGEWNVCWRTAPGVLKPERHYEATFRSRILENPGDSGLLFLVRPESSIDNYSDVISQWQNRGEKLQRIRFKTPAEPQDYAFQIHTHNRLKALISSFQLRELESPEQSVALDRPFSSGGSAATDAEPTGAPEFTIKRPEPAAGAPVLSVADFGASPDNPDNFAAFQQAIDACAAQQAAQLTVPPGTYRFRTNQSLQFRRLHNFRFDGNGALLIFLKESAAMMEIQGCEQVEFANFAIDWDWQVDPLASFVEVAAIDPAQDSVDLRFIDYEKFPVEKIKIRDIEEIDPATMSVGVEHSVNRWFQQPNYRWLKPNLLRLSGTGQMTRDMAVGQLFRMRHYVYDMAGICLSDNRHLTVENVTVHSVPSHAFVIGGKQQYWQLLNTHVRPPAGERRPITCTADHCHVAQSCGYFKMIGCEFMLGGDDCLNVHDISSFCQRADDHELQIARPGMQYYYKVGDELELRHEDYSPTGYRGKITGIWEKDGQLHLTMDAVLPEMKQEGFIVFNWAYDSSNILLRDNYFHDNRARGILLLGRNITVENNRFFHNQMGAIKIETGYTFDSWSEGYGAGNIIIRRNRFEQTNPQGTVNDGMERDIFIGVYLKSDPSSEKTSYPILHDILIEDNQFIDSYGLLAYISSAANVTLRGNRIQQRTPRQRAQPYRGSIYAVYTDGLTIEDNLWQRSKLAPPPRLIFDRPSVHNITVRGNSLVD